MYCHNCGSLIEIEGAAFCEQCGADLTSQMSTEEISTEEIPGYSAYEYPQNSKKETLVEALQNFTKTLSSKTKSIIICALAGVLLALIALFILLPGIGGKSENTPSDSVQNGFSNNSNEHTSGNTTIDQDNDNAPNIDNNIVPADQAPEQKQADPSNIIDIMSVSCSMYQNPGKYERLYTPEMAIDGDANTCWMASSEQNDGGAGNWIRIDFYGETTVSGIELINGNCWDGYYNGEQVYSDLFRKNGRIKHFTVCFSDGTSYQLYASDERETSFGNNVFVFPEPVVTSYIELEVGSSYIGEKYPTVVCLSEFQAFN